MNSYWVFYYTGKFEYWFYPDEQSDMSSYFGVEYQKNISKLVGKLAVL